MQLVLHEDTKAHSSKCVNAQGMNGLRLERELRLPIISKLT